VFVEYDHYIKFVIIIILNLLSFRDSQEALGELTAERKAQIQKDDSAR